MMCVYCCSVELENHLQTVMTVDSVYLRYVTYLRYMVTYLVTRQWHRGQRTNCCSERQARNINLTRVTVTLRYQTLPADSDRNRYTHTLIGNQTQTNNYNSSITKHKLTTQSKSIACYVACMCA